MEDYIRKAVNASGDEILLEAYDKEWALTDLGKHEGFKEGYAEGIQEGIQQGIQEGVQSKQAELILNMLKKDLEMKLISEISGLSIEEINNIKLNNI